MIVRGLLSWYCCLCVFFFFKQKTAYEMRISDWSSDVCSSDLGRARLRVAGALGAADLAARLIARRPAFFVRLGAGDEADIVGHVIVIGDDYSAHRIDRDSAPVGAAIIARIFDRAAVAGQI